MLTFVPTMCSTFRSPIFSSFSSSDSSRMGLDSLISSDFPLCDFTTFDCGSSESSRPGGACTVLVWLVYAYRILYLETTELHTLSFLLWLLRRILGILRNHWNYQMREKNGPNLIKFNSKQQYFISSNKN